MKFDFAVFNTDQINKKLIKFSAAGLMRSEEEHQREALLSRAPVGTPAHMQHDMHRVIGWSRQLGLYIDGEMVRVLGCIEYPENEEDCAQLQDRVARHRKRVNDAQTARFRDELSAKIGLPNNGNLSFLRTESVFAKREGLAAELYPEFFVPSTGLVDKDGLVEYGELLSRTTELWPGVFHDKKRDLVLVAHRFFRRRLSHLNALNTEFFRSFSGVAQENPKLRARLRLDPDLLGHPASTKSLIELEYWRGPKYDEDISKIPSGVAEHKADEVTRQFEGVDRTQIWWKAPETRMVGSAPTDYRTFEVEELIEDPSPGLADGRYGCRYAHAEYSSSADDITHFDGAIRAYDGDKYLIRFDASIDRAGKNSDYTKLFRFDGELSVPDWKRLLSDYYRGNNLIPEYLGAPQDAAQSRSATSSSAIREQAEAPLAAFISLSPGRLTDGTMLYPELFLQIGSQYFPFVEVGMGTVSKYLDSKRDKDVTPIGFHDDVLNLSRLGIVESDQLPNQFADEIRGLADALEEDIESGRTQKVAIPIMWQNDNIVVTLTLAGRAALVLPMLRRLPSLIDLTRMPSEWIEAMAHAIAEIAPVKAAAVIWDGVDRGIIEIKRSGEVEVQWPMSASWTEAAIASGLLKFPDQLARTDIEES
ncbi:hypothetical protein FHS78_003687 [Parvibaculum indicum]|uniref:hypothetical protein n=1 Tax=Parvibaculum indicum TaxID=562969 RepID=UPI00141FCA20|nr:hypothetical protein [Parvibaculum indicum]NIJ43372.1 hypothetical protein [Parvibaculum indicum]